MAPARYYPHRCGSPSCLLADRQSGTALHCRWGAGLPAAGWQAARLPGCQAAHACAAWAAVQSFARKGCAALPLSTCSAWMAVP